MSEKMNDSDRDDAVNELLGHHADRCPGCEDGEGRCHGLYAPSIEAVEFVAAWIALKRASARRCAPSGPLPPALKRMTDVLDIATRADAVQP